MDDSQPHRSHRGASSVAVAAVLLLLVGAAVLLVGLLDGQAPAGPATATVSAPAESGEPEGGGASEPPAPDAAAAPAKRPDFGRSLPGSPPVALSIPSIGVRAGTIVDLGLAADGTIEVPRDADNPGWFTPGPTPGQVGPAVIAGHVDSKTGPAVFARLGELRVGERIRVAREDGSTATFAVRRVETYDKDAFPTRSVYGATDRAALRLITCSGDYDAERGYLANTVVYAELV